MAGDKSKNYILWFSEIGIEDVPMVGGKNASLGEMYRKLHDQGINVPNGFAITAYAYRYFLKYAGIEEEIKKILKDLDTADLYNLMRKGREVRNIIRHAEFPPDLTHAIYEAYDKLAEEFGQAGLDNLDVAIRSSATAEDLPDASFAGQQDTFLNVRGKISVLDACKKCFASLFTNRAISYRHDKGFDQFEVSLSIAVQKMVRSDSAYSGVIFSIDTETGFKDAVFITAAYGLGENVVQGAVNPDEYYVFKPALKKGKRAIISRKAGDRDIKMVYSLEDDSTVKNVATTLAERHRYVLDDDEILQLARWACIIEDHYSKEAGYFKPMDIEWAKDGDGKTVGSGKLFVVQARPETIHSQKSSSTYETYRLIEKGEILVQGTSVGTKVGQGVANVIETSAEIGKFREGEVLITSMTDPDWEPIMKSASAIVTNKGGRTCHAAIVSRELGIPCVIGTGNADEVIKTGQKVTVSCCEGETGYVYDGLLKYEVQTTNPDEIPRTRTRIMLNVGIPEKAFTQGMIPNDGVGLAREEFIINSHIGIHPLALINYEELKKKAKNDQRIAGVVYKIDEITLVYENKTDFFVDKLAEGISRIAAGFYPNDVIVRLSDFKTNEYENLLGGYLYEPKENNPMLGWRGASRYYDEAFKPAFELECRAIHKARSEVGLTNIKVMVPFCRTPEEGKKVIALMKEFGLTQAEDGLEIYVMCEIPSNVIAADQFAEIFDGFSIGSNDLTQLALGLDRDSSLVSHIYDERNEAVKRLVAQVIEVAKEKGKKIGICGQAPSDFPEFAEFLVECGIDSMSVIPDTAIKTRLVVAAKEKELGINVE
ncbi:MAG: phosphoenolpyruvate synthase [Deltaproteobacteria bacterium]|nr:phosphoenolpyruvate synthase [Deltaproteobacteria bacterium]MBW1934106.1 phosphoenolpyruvate synthase [Deltaproteobacteria bacterium]MBW1976851.1 phosphoenolpyruvate synthase [Deltaproteobacteria bacterium]MBW2043877.1 phosphoenolpyruvate synthase [Deltaproteobacteria bacterium]MBW2300050.1 phosphoenolpyruvate synthase [Deltaproteobacteria bacterium]